MDTMRNAFLALLLALAAGPAAAVVYSTGLNGFNSTHSGMAYALPTDPMRIVGTGDFDANGDGDFVWRNSLTGAVSITTYLGPTPVTRVVYTETDTNWRIVGTGDFNGDGRSDLIWRNSASGEVYGMLMQGFAIIGRGRIHLEPNLSWRISAVGDFAGTSFDNQLLWTNPDTGQVFIQSVAWNGSGFVTSGQHVYQEPDTRWKVIGAADFDGDGRADILYRNTATGAFWLLEMDGYAVKLQGKIYQEADNDWKVVALTDFNNDGRADILWRHDRNGQVYMVLMQGLVPTFGDIVSASDTDAPKLLGGLQDPQ
jgi:hypothetical protein